MEARLSLPTLHQWPLGTRQAAPLAIGDATQFTWHRTGRELDLSIICRLILVQHASATRRARRTVVPARTAPARHCGRSGAGGGSTPR
jgi:hypothetical protein